MQCKPEYSVAEFSSVLRMVVDGRVWHQFLDTINNQTLNLSRNAFDPRDSRCTC